MKKRIFGMLLMGAMVVASMSMFTSCKDYDDDINAHSTEIASLKASLQEQKSSLEAAIAAAKQEASTANATLSTKLAELQTLVGNNKTDLENAIKAAVTESKEYADKVSADALKVAKEYADAAAKKAAEDAKAAALEEAKKTTDELAALIAANNTANADALAAKASELAAQIGAVDAKLVKFIDEEFEEKVNALIAANTQVKNIQLQITALENFQKEISSQVSDEIVQSLEATKGILDGVKKAAEKNAEDIAANKKKITDINDALDVIDGRISGIDDQIKKLQKAASGEISVAEQALKELINANTAEIVNVENRYKAANAALESNFKELLKSYVTKSDLQTVLAAYATTESLAPYAKTADVTSAIEAAVAASKAAMEAQITATLNAYDAKLAAALTALFATGEAESAAAADVTMSDEAIKALEALKSGYNNGVNQEVANQLNVLKVAAGKKLTSLVFRPEFYAHGIEAVEVMNLQTEIYDFQNANNKGTVNELWGLKGTQSVANNLTRLAAANGTQVWSVFAPLAKAYYHFNPTTADLKGANVKFYTNVAKDNFNTRAGYDALAQPAYDKIGDDEISKYVSNGILTVPFSVNRSQLNAIRYDNRGTLTGNEAFVSLSLSMTDEETGADTTVVSDYAMISPADYRIVALAGTWLTTAGNPHAIANDHLWRNIIAPAKTSAVARGILYKESATANYYSATDAMANYKLNVVYNESIDLKNYVKTHAQRRTVQNNSGNVTTTWSADQTLTDDELEALGLSYKFEVIHYNSGSNMTDEAKHIELDGSVAYPRSVTSAGEQISGEVATREIIGREPLIRVTLVDKDNNVVQHGYILLHISATAPSTNKVAIDLTGDYYMNCTASAELTWAQVEADILRAVGLSKAEFEATYELETVAADAAIASNQKTAVQYYDVNGDGSVWMNVNDYNTAVNAAVNADATLDTPAKKDAAAQARYIYPLGSVYLKSNTGNQQTSVLAWEIGSAVDDVVAFTAAPRVGTTNQTQATSIDKAMVAAGVKDLAQKGISKNDIKVTVAFKQKNTAGQYIESNAIYVTLRVPATKLHFAYAEISGKDLSLWYKNNSYLNSANSDESDAAEIHLNVPTPAAGATTISASAFSKLLTETFVSNSINLTGLDSRHFTQFTNIGWNFKLVAPTAANSTNIVAAKQKLTGASNTSSREYTNSWVVNGVTGAQYLLQVQSVPGTVGDTKIAIVAWKDPKTGQADNLSRDVVTLTLAGKIDYAQNKYAQDILNYSGRLNQTSQDLQTSTTEYLGVEDKTFTAFIQIVQNNTPCYDLLMPNEYFKARWLRPINVYNKGGMWTDALNTRQELVVAEIVGVKDWRNMEVNGSLTGTANVNAPFYGIADSTFQHFYVDAANIYTDHHKAVGDRAALAPTNIAAIEALKKTSDIPALANPAYFGVDNPTGAPTATNRKKAKLYYINTEANVGTFHLYVPVYVAYSFGEYSYDDKINGSFAPNAAAEAPLFTQKVYAVIEVKQTTNSQTQARKK